MRRFRLPTPSAMRIDAVLAVVLTIAGIVSSVVRHHTDVLALLIGVICTATVALRRRYPITAVLVSVTCTAAYALITGDKDITFEPLAVLLNFYILGRTSVTRDDLRIDTALLAYAIAAVAVSPGNRLVSEIGANWAVFIALPFAAGRAISSRAALTSELRAKAERLEQEQRNRALRAVSEERGRIARELHDVIAHSVSVMVIQTQAARRVAATDRTTARAALAAVEACGRDALAEMRRMMGVMRHGEEDLAGAATPALSELDTLIARARAAGLPVELSVEGEPRSLSPGLELVAFRVVQEALTNAIKHAGPAQAHVRVRFSSDALELDVADTGRGPTIGEAHADSGGHGLVGMRERLQLYGGALETGRRRGGGFRVHARVPLREQAIVLS